MGNLTSRILVAALLLPLAIAALWLGDWWLVALGVVAGVIAVHELCAIARDHRPVVLAAYAEYAFPDVLWPDFGPAQLQEAVGEFATRRRRFGGR